MDLFFITEARFVRDGVNVYCMDNSMTNRLWERYLAVFDCVKVVARVSSKKEGIKKENLASNSRVSFIDLPYYVGMKQYLDVCFQIRRVMSGVLVAGNAYICRVPGQLGSMAASILKNKGIPYGVEVVGDPWDVFAPGAFKHPLRVVLRYQGYWSLKKVVRYAVAALYVTKEQLQKRYPAVNAKWEGNASNVMIKSDAVPPQAHVLRKKERYELISVGSLAQMYKAPDVVIQALALLKERGVDVHVTWLGDGVYKENMQKYAQSLGVGDKITFVGAVSMKTVMGYLRASDIFILVSRTEGLPRALIEAMAEGLPCIATRVGGIPELLDDEMMIPKDNPEALAEKIEYLVRNLDVANLQAKRNYENGKEYYDDVLRNCRCCFYNYLVDYIR